MGIRIFDSAKPDKVMPMISKDARLIVWLGVGSRTANMNYVVMEAGESNVPHEHPESEDTIFILNGEGTVEDLTNGNEYGINAGDVVHVPAGVVHAVRADKGSDITSFGGPAPADIQMLEKMGIEIP
jgi:quercetin dioxygenase-like cupin family protein